MRFRQYLKDHWILFLCLFFAMLLISCLLLIMRLSGEGILFINLLVWMFLLIAILIDFIRKKKFYDNVMHNLETLDKKYLLHELLDPPHFAEGDILCEVLYQCNKSMADEVSVYRNHSKEYREYIETWVHEIKTPIASASLVYENNKTPATQSMYEEILNIVIPKKTIIILNKLDLVPKIDEKTEIIKNFENVIKISALKKEGIEDLYNKITELFNLDVINIDNEIVITNERHKKIIKDAIINLNKSKEALKNNMPIDIIAIGLKDVLTNLGEITGEEASEEIINEIFSRFCLGK